MDIKRMIDAWIRDERIYTPFASSSDDWINDPERMQRCDEAAAYGADGSTHDEVIEDMRRACLDHVGHARERLRTAVDRYFDELSAWHEQNGSLQQEIG